ncbi:hypothetical protein [Massilia soli]|uniref:DUF2946 domain-containing protein n=1 Tax=Massilia soli TaxID=2792854 RepID=A0ABS7SV08_9BURK|nr:hypothetical protein [Massilia soli]MBZ2209747.1 hypothetical protein [Massilia soli]
MKTLKSILAWLLLLALPLQGFAAVSMSMCEMGAPAAAASAPAAHASPPMPEGCEHHAAAVAGDDSAGGMVKCSTCAKCSVGAAIVAALPLLPQVNSHSTERIPYIAAHDTACIYGALERPPHSVA